MKIITRIIGVLDNRYVRLQKKCSEKTAIHHEEMQLGWPNFNLTRLLLLVDVRSPLAA